MKVLGIEGTAHTLGIGIVEGGKILADARSLYKPELGKGIIPHEAKQHHQSHADSVLEQALEGAKIGMEDVDAIAYSAGPGLPPCLLFTFSYASQLAKRFQKPLIPVNHCCAHLEIAKLTTGCKDPIFLYLSGGNTQVIAYVGGRYRVFGETCDVAVGNCLDVVARSLGLAGGAELEKLALQGKYVKLPYCVKGMDVSFSGIITAALKLCKKGVARTDIAYSLQETCFAMLTEVAERALAHVGKLECLVTGGVAANRRLRQMISCMCEEREAKAYFVPPEYAGDNGVMIAWLGLLQFKTGCVPKLQDFLPNWRVDQLDACWVQSL